MFEVEAFFQSKATGQHRRGLLGALTMDSDKVFSACEEAPGAFFELFKLSAATIVAQKELAEMMAAAHNRLMVGLCGIDTSDPDSPFTQEEFTAAIDEARGTNSEASHE